VSIVDRILSTVGLARTPPDAAPPPPAAVQPRRAVVARYDAAERSRDTERHWIEADPLSSRAANNVQVRRTLRMRARYEVANSSYLKGIVETLANDTIGTGPRLQLLTPNAEANRAIEAAFSCWAQEIGLPEKLRTMRKARAQDGEAFGRLVTNPALKCPVRLDLKLYEADQVATPVYFPFDPRAVDGIRFDDHGNPTEYHVLPYHPGDLVHLAPYGAFERVPADLMVHWFRVDRPGQSRGVPDITPALPLFAQLRRYTLAVIAAAETAADFSAVLETDAPADDSDDDSVPMERFEIEKRMMATLPAGWKLNQLRAEQPTTTYPQFKAEILNEAARCLNMPFNVAAGNSSGYNYSSGRLDHQVYYKSLKVDQSQAETVVLDPLLAEWLGEAALALPGLIPQGLTDWPHQWFWDGAEHVDPQKEADAQATRLKSRTTTYAREFARQGRDWQAEFRQIAAEQAEMKALGITPPDAPATPPAPPGKPTPKPPDDGGGDAADSED
jgi:lambda family phage portal protein